MPPRRGFVPRPPAATARQRGESDGRGCRRQVRDLVFLVLVLQICRADGWGREVAERRHDNSPAFQCRDKSPQKPKSRRDDRGLPDEIQGHGGNNVTFVLPSLRDSCQRRRIPGVETPGYCRVVPLGRWNCGSGRESAHSSAGRSLSRLTPAATGKRWMGAGESRNAGGCD